MAFTSIFCNFFEAAGQRCAIADPICMSSSVVTSNASFVTDDATLTPANPTYASGNGEILPLYFEFSTFFANPMKNGQPTPILTVKRGGCRLRQPPLKKFTTQRKPTQRAYR